MIDDGDNSNKDDNNFLTNKTNNIKNKSKINKYKNNKAKRQ